MLQLVDQTVCIMPKVHGTKNAQKDDSEHVQNIANTKNKNVLRIEQELHDVNRKPDEVQQGFTAALCNVLVVLNAATSRHKVSSVLLHWIVCNGGTRFNFSHGFADYLISQLDAVVENKDVWDRICTNLLNGKPHLWPDSSSDDCLYRPTHKSTQILCLFEMTMWYRKV